MYNDNGAPIDPNQLVSGDGLVMKNYLLAAYPNLVNGVKESGLWTCGDNSSGQNGANQNISYASTPVQTVSAGLNWKMVAVGTKQIAGIKTDGSLWLWGDNTNGQMGNNTNSNSYSSPVQTVSGGNNWKMVAIDKIQNQGVAAIKTDGTLWFWGNNGYFNLTSVISGKSSSPVQIAGGGTNWQFVTFGMQQGIGIKTDGTLWAWGGNAYGEIGNGVVGSVASPTQEKTSATNWKMAAGGRYLSSGIRTDGTLWLWGENRYNLVNLTTSTSSGVSTPVQVTGGGTNWKTVSLGLKSVGAIKTDGTLWMWGYNHYGECCTNNTSARTTPTQEFTLSTNWKSVSVNQSTTALKTDGTIWSWGNGVLGQSAIGNINNFSSPVQIAPGGNNWRQVDSGLNTWAAIGDFIQL